MIKIFSDFIQCNCVDNPNDLTREYVVHADDFLVISYYEKDITMYVHHADSWEKTSANVIRERKGALYLLAEM
jgi:hypothetical protein